MTRHKWSITALSLIAAIIFGACSRETAQKVALTPAASRPSILLVTLDTTRADAIGPQASGVETPAYNALAAGGRLFTQAYASVPETLPSHSSIMTGLYPAAHGVHENARYLSPSIPVAAEQLRNAGFRTAAFVSAYPLDRRYGLARGFELYDDELREGATERSARETADRAIGYIEQQDPGTQFIWVHFFDPHHPYEPAEPFRSQYADQPYRGEIAAMDHELGRVVEAFRRKAGADAAIIVTGDHGESLGEHGEAQHGHLVYQGAMHVPLVVAGPGVGAGVVDVPVSNRRIYHTLLDWAGLGADHSLRGDSTEVVMGEAMKPFLNYGWQPQTMAVESGIKVISAGAIEVYDVVADPAEQNDLAGKKDLTRPLRQGIRDYPIPSLEATPVAQNLSDEERRQLASLGYVSSETKPLVRKDAPRPRDMVHLLDRFDRASALFVNERYREAIPILESILAEDPNNLMSVLRLAVAHSALGQESRALEAFRRAESIAPDSGDVRHYLALHHMRTGEWQRAAPLLERVVVESPHRLPALEALSVVRERQGRFDEALRLMEKVEASAKLGEEGVLRLGDLAMRAGNTPTALRAFERARALQGAQFERHLELGVLYLDARRLAEAREALDAVPAGGPGYPMALFKRAQVSVLLNEPDAPQRIARARQHADASTAPLIARERLFR